MTIPHCFGKRDPPPAGGGNHPEGCQALFVTDAANKDFEPLAVAPMLGISVLEPEDAGRDVGNDVFTIRHLGDATVLVAENFDGVVVKTVGAHVERALNGPRPPTPPFNKGTYPAGAGLVTLLDAASRTISPPIRYVVEHVPFWRFAFSIRSSLVLFAVRGELSNLD
jgi:hypothetical protein